jgi:prepilin-type processing-associated H-X9-DG protein
MDEQQDWTIKEVNTTHKRQFVRLEATWQGMRTLGATAVVTLDTKGNILFVDGGAKAIQVEPQSTEITRTEARRIAMDTLHSSRGGVIPMGEKAPVERLVHVDGYTGTIVYEVKVGLPGEMGVAFVYVDAGNGHVLWVRNPVQH